MTRYAADHARLGEQKIVVLTDVAGNRRLRIARHGAALLSYEVAVAGVVQDLADGYRSRDRDLRRQSPALRRESMGRSSRPDD